MDIQYSTHELRSQVIGRGDVSLIRLHPVKGLYKNEQKRKNLTNNLGNIYRDGEICYNVSNNTRHGGMTVKKFVPVYEGELRKHSIQVPRCISECSGIRIFGRRIKSLVFSTDVAIIKNINADAVIAVYPFTPQPAITQPFCRCRRCRCLPGWGVASPMGRGRPASPPMPSIRGPLGWCATPSSPRRPSGPSKRRWRSPLVYTVVSEQADVAGEAGGGGGFPQRIRGGPDAGDRGPYPGEIPGGAYHCHRRADGRHHPATIELGPMPSPTRRPPAPSCFPRVCGNTGASLRKGLRRSRK